MNTGLSSYNLENSVGITNTCITLDNIFTESELEEIITNCSNFILDDAAVAENKNLNSNIRKSKTKFIHEDKDTKWLFDKLKSKIEYVNNNTYRLDLVGFEVIQYTEYAEYGSKYDWHMDMFFDSTNDVGNLTRKLSISVILSDSNEYDGGEFEILKNFENPLKIEQKRNRLIAFPSYLYHRITPITRGKRCSLVIWVLGPKFK